jgi:hypothetical protein
MSWREITEGGRMVDEGSNTGVCEVNIRLAGRILEQF